MKNTLFYKRISLFLTGLLFLTTTAFAQTKTVTGTVTDAENYPLIGVSISVIGSPGGTITDVDGSYSISVPADASLQFTYIGFIPQTIPVKNENVINVTLLENKQTLDEVVVVGYGVQKKSHLTGSISKVDIGGLEDIPISSIDQALQGRISGVQIQNNTSEVGESASIRVRGMGSISASDSPLIIIDGFPVEDGLNNVNPADIESIEVLKDAASAAIYGSRAANGVIMVTTKSGEVKKPKYTFKANYGLKSAYKLHPIMTSQEYVNMRVNESRLLGLTELPSQDFAYAALNQINGDGTDWQKEALRTASIYNLNFSVSGGTNEVRYYISAAYVGDQGIMHYNENNRMNVRAKIDATLSKKVKVGINLSPTYVEKQKPGANFGDFYRYPSWMPVRHNEATAAFTGKEIGSYTQGSHFNNLIYSGIDPLSGNERVTGNPQNPFSTSNHNPRQIMDTDKRYTKEYRMNTFAYLTAQLAEGLEFRTSDGFNVNYTVNDGYRDRNSKQDGIQNRGYYDNRMKIDLLSENTLTYLKKINSHDFNLMGGFSAQKTNLNTAGIVGIDFPTDMIPTLNAAGSIATYEDGDRVTGTWKESEALLSAYARLMYSYQDKYLLSASWRTDGSSKFGDKNRWAQFPSVSLGWRASEESFMAGQEWIDQLKLRASYGVTGNDRIVNFAKMDLLSSANYSFGSGTGTVTSGMANNSSTLGNPRLQWEQTNETNLGIDVNLFRRIALTVEYYYSITKSLLFEQNISTITGYGKQWTNLGKVRNRGLEIDLTTYNIQQRNFSWQTSFNFSTNSNRLLDLGGPEYQISYVSTDDGGGSQELYIAKVGEPSIQFYGFKTIGVWANQEEIDANPHHNSDQPGGLRVWDADDSGKIDDNDRVVIGDPFPDFTWGITNTFKYKNFDLSFLIQGVQGVDVFNDDARQLQTMRWNENYVKNRWISPEHPGDGKTPYETNGITRYLTDYMIQDGSYIALRDITLSYTLPGQFARKLGLQNLRTYVSGQNVAFWWPSDYKGINPEARYKSGGYASNPLIDGCQRGGFPIQRTFSIGVDVTF